MKMRKLFVTFFLSTVFVPTGVFAQDSETDSDTSDDVELSMEIGVEKKLSKKWNVGGEAEFRLRDDISKFDRFTIGPTAEYKITPWLKASAGFLYMYVNNDSKLKYRDSGSLKWIRNEQKSSRYRAFIALTGSVGCGRWKFSLRERYQFTYRPEYTAMRDYYTSDGEYNYSEKDVRQSKTYNVMRSRLAASYDIRHCPLTPFAYIETYNDFDDHFSVAKMRYSAGVDWKVDKHNVLSLKYYYQDVNGDDGDNDRNTHMIGVGYTYKF